jgi:hypothetical protein
MVKQQADFLYDCALWIFNIMLDVFFREIRPRGSHKIPLEGPLIFVAAPHANQVGRKKKWNVCNTHKVFINSKTLVC